jgi:hypothetical protein
MNAVVYVFEADQKAPTGFPIEADNLEHLVSKCVFLLLPDKIREVNAWNTSGTALLFNGYKSEKKPVIIYKRSKYPK